jgi:hypothetical protein
MVMIHLGVEVGEKPDEKFAGLGLSLQIAKLDANRAETAILHS